MDFGLLPPEIDSARMYAGAGSAPLSTAATAWDWLAAELHDTAASYSSVISGVTENSWSGSASNAMAAAAGPYVTWMTNTAAQAEQSANQARAAASAYETALAMTVPPALIADNRSLWMSLIASNFLGQNTPAIAGTEADYAETWACDASTLTPFTSSPPATNADQAAAVGQATNSRAALSEVMSAKPQTPQETASPLSSAPPTFGTSGLPGALPTLSTSKDSPFGLSSLGGAKSPAVIGSSTPMPLANISKALTTGAAGQGVPALVEALLNWLGSGPGVLGSAGSAGLRAPAPVMPAGPWDPAVSAGMGRATTIGALSVPEQWRAVPTPESVGSGLPLASSPGLHPGRPAAIPLPAVMSR